MNNDTNTCDGRSFCYRLLAYSVVVAASMQAILLLVQNGYRNILFSENGPMESVQFVLAASAGGWLLFTGRKGHPVVTVFGLVALFAAGRELDGLLGNHSYKLYMAPPILLLTASTVWRNRDTFSREVWKITGTPAWCLLATSGITVCLFAQIIGQKELWMELMGESYTRVVKNAVEESAELFGYLFLFFGAVEVTWVAKREAAVEQLAPSIRLSFPIEETGEDDVREAVAA